MNDTDTKTLGDQLPVEVERVQEILVEYKKCGRAGAFAAAMMKGDLKAASEAMISGDLIGMIKAYESLKEYSL